MTRVAEVAMDAVGKGGKLMIFGVTPGGDKASFEPFRIYNEEITIVGSMAVLTSYGRAVDIVAAGGVDAGRMVTDTFGLEGFGDALDAVRRGSGLKVQIRPGG